MATTPVIRTEPPPAQPRWTSLSETILEGGYELQDLLEATDTKARFKVRVLGDRELESFALLFPIPDAEIERQVELWQNVKALRHPHLSAPLGAGRLQLDGVPLAYVVLRRADEVLATVLSERSLTVEEAGEALVSVARALEALHVNGWVHGCVSPDAVLAVGDYIQLPGECVRTAGAVPSAETAAAKYLAPESARTNVTPEADLWCLGATLFEALTRKMWTEGLCEEREALPEPFASITVRCLETDPKARCSLAEAVALYRGELKLPARVRTAAEAMPKLTTSVDPAIAALPAVAAAPSNAMAASVLSAQSPDTDPVDANLPQPAAIAALAPEAEARATDAPGSGHRSPNNSDAYTHTKPSLAARPHRKDPKRRSARDEEGKSTSKIWIGAGLGLLLMVALIWILQNLKLVLEALKSALIRSMPGPP